MSHNSSISFFFPRDVPTFKYTDFLLRGNVCLSVSVSMSSPRKSLPLFVTQPRQFNCPDPVARLLSLDGNLDLATNGVREVLIEA